jgi:hypothetical protein
MLCALAIVFACSPKQPEIKREITQPKPVTIEKPVENTASSSTEKTTEKSVKNPFYSAIDKSLSKRNQTFSQICDDNDSLSKRILQEYGAMFVAVDSVMPPSACVFTSSAEVESFQSKVQATTETINGVRVELQSNAMKAYLAARDEAQKAGLDIRPRGGEEASRRGFDKTLELWKSRVNPACEHWLSKGRLTSEQIQKLKSLGLKEQVTEVLRLEESGIFFNTFFNRTILSSVAAPGTSQHLSMLALDIEEFKDKRVREIMATNGWFRTVQNDAPHFTFLGRNESELAGLGIKKVETEDGEFWVPNI